MNDDAARLLEELRFRPRESLGPEIAGRARRGEVAKGGLGPRRVPPSRRLLAVAAALAALTAAGLAARAASP
ncbi:MAG TPA: hypothetical protein VFX50_18860, partial [Gemmatimonadales bacterium]|nr:hypothetical protein [Gemmatimonadales bacterium]